MVDTVEDFLVKHSIDPKKEFDNLENFLAHHGIKGMKWGVRKDRKGFIKARSTMTRRDAKEANWLDSQKTEAFNETYNKVYKKAARKIRGSIRKVNRDPRFKGQDFLKRSALRDTYYKEINKAVTNQLNAASTLKGQSPKKRFEMHFDFDLTKSSKPVATIRQVDTRKGQKEQRSEAKRIRSLKHSDSVDSIEIPLIVDDRGFIQDVGIPDSYVQHILDGGMSVDEVTDFLAHSGVKGMKWGIRKDRSGRRRPTKQVLAEERRQSRKSNTLSSNPQNKRMTDSQMSALIRRIEMEQKLSKLTAPQKAPPSRLKNMMKDVAFDVTKGALTEVGKLALSQALKVNYNKMAGPEYKIAIKKIQETIDKAS